MIMRRSFLKTILTNRKKKKIGEVMKAKKYELKDKMKTKQNQDSTRMESLIS